MEDRGGRRSIDHYVLGKTLGIGSFGKVKRKLTSDAKRLRASDLRLWRRCEAPAPRRSDCGVFAVVFPFSVAVHKETSIKVAIKVLNKKKVQALDMNDKVWREINVLKLFSHPHIIRL